ncbi:hypothetical protein PG999_004421 [Apiospora kogelbergensis]|uniref:NmrA-like domain-containing protein n=1 Tax=Apiospora kogelbergensis TaxID=1337665 RepID=A0AAW0QZ67_9PEZI
MGKVTLIGGSGNVAREVIDAILKRGKHNVMICSRKSIRPVDLPPVVQWAVVDYSDHVSLVSVFRGTDTVLSFVTGMDAYSGFQVEKQAIDAAIEAGVQRYAPSQWAARSDSGITHYAFKDKVLQYTLFQPGFFTDYLAFPHCTAPHFHNMQMMFDFQNRRAIIISGSEDAPITLTTVSDTALVVAAALDYAGPWPEVGGICGTQTTIKQILTLGENLRGQWDVTRIDASDVQNDRFVAPWYPLVDHPSLSEEMREHASKMVLREYLLSSLRGGWSVSNEWNKLLNMELTSMEEYLATVWQGKD